ncbi:MAG: hypothetical protein H6621_10345 [Halobacteriovoraceae bacterium]|nr:hypothetical protein [Halobacteriovoraceae bacterium]MCB9095455.1 hypothetical protein [Halobacteriovoraceae bacterium]
MVQKSLFAILSLFLSIASFAFDEDVLKEIENIKTTKSRECSSGSLSLKINGGKIEISDSSNKFGHYQQYNIYDESGDFILADHITITNIDYAKNNFLPELVILKKKDKAYLLEGLSFKFRKFGYNENCKGESISNLHCYSRIYNTNLSSFKNKIILTLTKKKLRDLAGLLEEMVFPYDQFDFHSSAVRVGNNGSLKRAVALVDTDEVVNLIYSYPSAKSVLKDCHLQL